MTTQVQITLWSNLRRGQTTALADVTVVDAVFLFLLLNYACKLFDTSLVAKKPCVIERFPTLGPTF